MCAGLTLEAMKVAPGIKSCWSISKNEVLPAPMVGDVRVRIGEMANASCAHANTVHNAIVSTPPLGSERYLLNWATRLSRSLAPAGAFFALYALRHSSSTSLDEYSASG